jgi:hypothetical protein
VSVYDVFLSHHHGDHQWTAQLAGALEELGLRAFFAPHELQAGQALASVLDDAIRASRHVVVIVSQETAASKWVELEVNLAVHLLTEHELRSIIPVLRDRHAAVPGLLGGLLAIVPPASRTPDATAEAIGSLVHDAERPSPLESHADSPDPRTPSTVDSAPATSVDRPAAVLPSVVTLAPPPAAAVGEASGPHVSIRIRFGDVLLPFIRLSASNGTTAALASTPLTIGQLKALFPDIGPGAEGLDPRLPVTSITLEQALALCSELTRRSAQAVRLPTPGEWEEAYRAGQRTRFFFGHSAAHLGEYAHVNALAPAPVATYRPNPWGFYDMAGNVWELCREHEWSRFCVARGGSFLSSPEQCTALYWIPVSPQHASAQIGLRLLVEGPLEGET